MFNSHGMSWQWIAKIVQNSDNGGNGHDSSKKLKRLPLKFKDESFGAIEFSQKIFQRNFTGNEPKIDLK